MKRFSMLAIFFFVIIYFSASVLAQEQAPTRVPPGGFHQIIPWGISCAMKGTVTNVAVVDNHIHFQLNGWFWFSQYPEGGTSEQIIRVDCHNGVSVTLSQVDSFVAETADWNGGSVQNNKDRLVEILQTAEKRGNIIKFTLINPRLNFMSGTNDFAVLDGKIWQITDADLH